MPICPQLYTFIRFLVIRIIKTLILAGILSSWSYFLLDGSLPQLTLLPVAHKDFSLITRFRKWGGGAKSFENLQFQGRKLSRGKSLQVLRGEKLRRGRLPSNGKGGSVKLRGQSHRLCWSLPIYSHLISSCFYSFLWVTLYDDLQGCKSMYSVIQLMTEFDFVFPFKKKECWHTHTHTHIPKFSKVLTCSQAQC